MHQGDMVIAVLFLHIPQDAQYMGLNGGFTAHFVGVQWNEYPGNQNVEQ